MKKIFTLVALLIFGFAKAQELDISPLQWDGENVVYKEVMDVDGYGKKEIFIGIKKHLINSFKNYDKVVQVENEEMGVISGRAITTVPFVNISPGTWDIWYNFQIDIKDGKFRVNYSNFEEFESGYTLEMMTRNGFNGKPLKKLRGPAKDVFPNLGLHFEEEVMAMKKSITTTDNW